MKKMSSCDEISYYDELMKDPSAVFVFGSNMAGRHGAGAALKAYQQYGAVRGFGEGHHGRSYAIPTKDRELKTLRIDDIWYAVWDFLGYAAQHPELKFVVTRIGCGLAGYDDPDIAPMFKSKTDNVMLSPAWDDILNVIEENEWSR